MKLFKAVFYSALFAALLFCGCFFLYNRDVNAGIIESNLPNTEPAEQISAAAFAQVVPDIEPVMQTEPEPEEDGFTVSFTFLGDCILSTNVGDNRKDTFIETAKKEPDSYFFDKAKPYYKNSDFVMANCEFVMTNGNPLKTQKDGTAFWFKSPVSFVSILRSAGIDLVTIANNHTYDYGEEGYSDTKAALKSADIAWGDLANPLYVEKNGVVFGIICTNLFSKNYDPMITPVIDEVNKNSDIQIMYFHGGTEKEHTPEDWMVELCHKYADMGVDLIIGSHPHVLRPLEEYNGVDIFYSLGNFCYGANRLPENRTIILTETFCFDENGVYTGSDEEIIPFYVYTGDTNNWQPAPIEDEDEKSAVLSFMYSASELPY